MTNKEILIFVEGSSDKVFLEVYLYFLGNFPIKNFKVKDVKGKDNLSKRLLEIEKYDKTLIIFDADIKKRTNLSIFVKNSKKKGLIFPKNKSFYSLTIKMMAI